MSDDGCEWFAADCRVRAATDLIRNRWDPVVLAALRAGPTRRARLVIAIGDISDKALTESLRRLVRRGLVRRDSARGVAVYELTDLGASFAQGPLLALTRWFVEHEDALAVSG